MRELEQVCVAGWWSKPGTSFLGLGVSPPSQMLCLPVPCMCCGSDKRWEEPSFPCLHSVAGLKCIVLEPGWWCRSVRYSCTGGLWGHRLGIDKTHFAKLQRSESLAVFGKALPPGSEFCCLCLFESTEVVWFETPSRLLLVLGCSEPPHIARAAALGWG